MWAATPDGNMPFKAMIHGEIGHWTKGQRRPNEARGCLPVLHAAETFAARADHVADAILISAKVRAAAMDALFFGRLRRVESLLFIDELHLSID